VQPKAPSIPTAKYIYGDGSDDEAWIRQCATAEEDCLALASVDPRLPRGNPLEFRWYRSPNIIDLARVRHVRAKKAGVIK